MADPSCSLGLTVNLACLNGIADRLGALSIDLATNREGSAQDLLDGTLERLGVGLVPHRPGDLNDLVQGHGLVVLDVLLLLAVTRGLLERADDERGCGGNDGHGGLTVLDGELHGDAETLLFNCNESSRQLIVPHISLRGGVVFWGVLR